MTQELSSHADKNSSQVIGRAGRWFNAGAYGFLALFIGSTLISVMVNMAGWKLMTGFCVAVMWGALTCYFIFGAFGISSGIRGWSGRLFSTAVFFP